MSPIEISWLSIGALIMLIMVGMPIGIGIGMLVASFVSVQFIRSDMVAVRMLGQVANDSLEKYLFAVVPLFVLMGLLVTVSGVGRDTFDVFQRLLHRVAALEMVRHDYTRKFATGVMAGSSVLGMLITPSLLFIVYAVLAEESVGRMFLAGISSGIVLALVFCATIFVLVRTQPKFVFDAEHTVVAPEPVSVWSILQLAAPILALITLVLDGLYGGLFNPTEAGTAGAFGALVIALLRRSLNRRTFWKLLVETGHITVLVLFLILAASFFSRMLALSGMPRSLAEFLLDGLIGPWGGSCWPVSRC